MTCQHLRKLYQLCRENNLSISSSDVVRITCRECDEIEVCPSMLSQEYEARLAESGDAATSQQAGTQ